MNVLMIFLDGVGMGSDDPEVNPFSRFELPCLDELLSEPEADSNRLLRHLDANLGVDGLPQSGTGQATLFTGRNCARIVGRHFGPFPHSATKETLAEQNIFVRVNRVVDDHARGAAFANAYPPPFFKMVERNDRWTVTTRCCLDARIQIRNLEDLAEGNALAADITGARLSLAGFPVEPVTEETAARALASLAAGYRFTLFEYFLTDKAGHSRSFEKAEEVLRSLDRFLEALLQREPTHTTIVVTSDHGNLEDLSTRSHTRNPVPLIAVGHGAAAFQATESLTDVTPAIIGVLQG